MVSANLNIYQLSTNLFKKRYRPLCQDQYSFCLFVVFFIVALRFYNLIVNAHKQERTYPLAYK